MNYELLFNELPERRVRLALTGANGGFSRTLLVQCRALPNVSLAALCDLNPEGTLALLADLGYDAGAVRVCSDAGQVRRAVEENKIVLVRDYRLLVLVECDMLVEATGHPEVSVQIAIDALKRGVHVGMVSKETDSVAGPYLNELARQHGVVYTTVDGDQPSNLIGLVTWARVLGFDIVAAGKSSEYDYVYHAASEEVEYSGRRYNAAGMAALWDLKGDLGSLLDRRDAVIADIPKSATPDYCELNVVSNSTGLLPACPSLNYPMCHISELADILIPLEDGGILTRTGVVDVFNCLRRHDEVSFGGGVFVIVRCTDDEVWELLAGKGHVVSRNRKYACIYTPFHLMGLESMMSIFSAVLHGRSSGSTTQRMHSTMLATAERDFKAGESLVMGGHHHTIVGMTPSMVPTGEAAGMAPFYLAANKRLRADVAKGQVVTIDMLELDDSGLYDAWQRNPA
jgi:predicted homoserine dehydrogenase-like protein